MLVVADWPLQLKITQLALATDLNKPVSSPLRLTLLRQSHLRPQLLLQPSSPAQP